MHKARSVCFAGLVGCALLGAYVVGGCSLSVTSTPGIDSGTFADTGTGVDSGGPAQTVVLNYTASNVGAALASAGIDVSQLADLDIIADTTLNSDSDTTLLLPTPSAGRAQFFVGTQTDGSRIGVYIAKSWKIESGITVHVQGEYAVAFVSADTFDVAGAIDVSSTKDTPGAGGASPGNTAGVGTGAGGSGNATTGVAAAGGGLCGVGGGGGFFTGQTAATPGIAYSVASLVPIVGGSTGGIGNGSAGAGGGALQISANTSFTLEAGGIIAANGGGGAPSGTVAVGAVQVGAGGGSGGSVLIEAPTVTISGVIAANGGGGGGNSAAASGGYGQDGQASATPATGSGTGSGLGGNGSGGATLTGTAGASGTAGSVAPGGGGGGSGAIRINSTAGTATVTSATLSPASTTACFSQGTLNKQ